VQGRDHMTLFLKMQDFLIHQVQDHMENNVNVNLRNFYHLVEGGAILLNDQIVVVPLYDETSADDDAKIVSMAVLLVKKNSGGKSELQ